MDATVLPASQQDANDAHTEWKRKVSNEAFFAAQDTFYDALGSVRTLEQKQDVEVELNATVIAGTTTPQQSVNCVGLFLGSEAAAAWQTMLAWRGFEIEED